MDQEIIDYGNEDDAAPVVSDQIQQDVGVNEVDDLESEDDSPDFVSLALQLTSLPVNANQYLHAVTGEEVPLTAINYAIEIRGNESDYVMQRADESELFIAMVNQGNLLEIEAEFKRQLDLGLQSPAFGRWQEMASAMLDLYNDSGFSARRAVILRPVEGMGVDDIESVIQDCKTDLLDKEGVPQGIDKDEISWDALSYKIPPSVSECFCQKYPQAADQLSMAELALLDEAEKVVFSTILEKCTEFRTRTNTSEDDFIPDMTLYLENEIAGKADWDRSTKFDTVGELVLVKYVDMMSSLFASGHIPGTIPPVKIFASHDITSQIELRSTIQKLNDLQTKDFTTYTSTTTMNPNVFRRSQIIADGTSDLREEWSEAQARQIELKKRVDQNVAIGQFSMGKSDYMRPQKELGNQLSGGHLSLKQQVELNATDSVLELDEQGLETLRYQVSLLLACLRVRAEATQNTGWELMADGDLDHFEIVKKLAQISNITLNDKMQMMATSLQEAYQTGHNTIKFNQKTLPEELVNLIKYSMSGRLRQILKGIQLFEQNMNEDGGLVEEVLKCAHQTVALKQRIKIEVNERYNRRHAMGYAAQHLLK